MINWLTRKKVDPIHAVPGDTVTAIYRDDAGRTEEVSAQITKAAVIDTIAVGEFEDELGMKRGVLGVFGEDK